VLCREITPLSTAPRRRGVRYERSESPHRQSTECDCDTVLLPSMRFGRLYSKLPDGKRVFLTTDRQLVCEHGELSSTICFWLSMEKKARVDCMEAPQRGVFNPSVCERPAGGRSTEVLTFAASGSFLARRRLPCTPTLSRRAPALTKRCTTCPSRYTQPGAGPLDRWCDGVMV
jgi:hypothetical protein